VAKVGAHFRNWTAFFVELCADCNSFRVCVSVCLASVHRQPVPPLLPHTHAQTERENLKILIACFDTKWRCKNELELMMRHANPDEAEDVGTLSLRPRLPSGWVFAGGFARGSWGPKLQCVLDAGLLCVGCAGCKCAF